MRVNPGKKPNYISLSLSHIMPSNRGTAAALLTFNSVSSIPKVKSPFSNSISLQNLLHSNKILTLLKNFSTVAQRTDFYDETDPNSNSSQIQQNPLGHIHHQTPFHQNPSNGFHRETPNFSVGQDKTFSNGYSENSNGVYGGSAIPRDTQQIQQNSAVGNYRGKFREFEQSLVGQDRNFSNGYLQSPGAIGVGGLQDLKQVQKNSTVDNYKGNSREFDHSAIGQGRSFSNENFKNPNGFYGNGGGGVNVSGGCSDVQQSHPIGYSTNAENPKSSWKQGASLGIQENQNAVYAAGNVGGEFYQNRNEHQIQPNSNGYHGEDSGSFGQNPKGSYASNAGNSREYEHSLVRQGRSFNNGYSQRPSEFGMRSFQDAQQIQPKSIVDNYGGNSRESNQNLVGPDKRLYNEHVQNQIGFHGSGGAGGSSLASQGNHYAQQSHPIGYSTNSEIPNAWNQRSSLGVQGNQSAAFVSNVGGITPNANRFQVEPNSNGYYTEGSMGIQQNPNGLQNGLANSLTPSNADPNDESAEAGNMQGTIEELDGFCKEKKVKEAAEVLDLLEKKGITVDLPRYVLLMLACGDVGVLQYAKSVHNHLIRSTEHIKVSVHNKILEMYSKCGSMSNANEVFAGMPERNLSSWDIMITGLAKNGLGEDAIDLFTKFKEAGLRPDDQMFMGVFLACSVLFDIDEGLLHFESMSRDYGIVPSMEHYVSVVNMLGSAGYLDEAKEFIEKMPIEPTVDVWEALMNICRVHGNTDLGDHCAEMVNFIDPSRLTDQSKKGLLPVKSSDVAAEEEKRKSNRKLELRSATREYRAGDKSHPEDEALYALLRGLTAKMKEAGYVPELRVVLHDIADESKAEALLAHSEKLAVAQALINSSARSPIRVIKNLRKCVDCHNAMKLISKIVGRDLIIRDIKRFHHFRNGECSCKDFW